MSEAPRDQTTKDSRGQKRSVAAAKEGNNETSQRSIARSQGQIKACGGIMIVEIAEFSIRPESQREFDAAIQRGVESVIAFSPGFRRYEVQRGIESPGRYVLLIEWDSVESHTVDFRGSDAFLRWREFVGPYFVKPPQVEHFERVCGTRAA